MTAHHEADVRATVRSFVAEIAPHPDVAVSDDSRLIEDLGFHSLALIELAFSLEDEFHLDELDEQATEGIRTVLELADYVVAQLAVGAAPN